MDDRLKHPPTVRIIERVKTDMHVCVCGGGGGGICIKTAHQIRVRVNACAVYAYISCERMRSACLKFVPHTW